MIWNASPNDLTVECANPLQCIEDLYGMRKPYDNRMLLADMDEEEDAAEESYTDQRLIVTRRPQRREVNSRGERSNAIMAVRVGFEPTVPVKVRQFSRLLDSTSSRTSPFFPKVAYFGSPAQMELTVFDCLGCLDRKWMLAFS